MEGGLDDEAGSGKVVPACCKRVKNGRAGRRESGAGRKPGIGARARGEIEGGVVVSCGTSTGERWRARQQLSGGEPLNDMHGASADGTVPVGGRARVIWSGRWGLSGGVGSTGERLEAEWEQRGSMAVGEEAEVTDAHETARQQVEQEAAQELIDGQSEQALLVGMGGVSPAEGDRALFECNQSAVGDGDAMRVAAEIAQSVFGATEGWLGVDDPLVAEEGSAPSGEGSGVGKWGEVSMELELVVAEGGLESVFELTAKDLAEHIDMKKEAVP